MQNVNLLDPRLQPAEPLVRSGTALAALAAAAALVLLHGLVEQQLTRRALAATAAAASGGEATEAATEGAAPTALSRLRAQVDEREAWLAAVRADGAVPAQPAATLQRIVAALPETMWLTEVELHGSAGLRIRGGTLDPLALAEFARRLALAEPLRGLGLQTLRLEPDDAPAAAEDAPAPAPTHRFVLASHAAAAEADR
ncbi:MAG: PilN domain-containing protein [Burkholderiales bacterium]|nr:PilN domain-containing protein [Burkholderiales bacterium]